MKTSDLIPPVLALATVIAWNVHQMRTITVLERDGKELRERISVAEASRVSGTDSRSEIGTSPARSGNIDWKQVPAQISGARNGSETSQLRTMIDLQQRLKKMSREELIAALDEIEGLDLTSEDRDDLTGMILESMIKLDPQYALGRFVDQIESDGSGVSWQLATAFGDWAKKDPAAATAWFDRQIAAGKFESKSLDGRSEMRAEFESSVLETLLSSDLEAAGRRLLALPEDQRREVLEQLSFPELETGEQKAYASLVRQLIPADERAGSFANIASQLVDDGDYEQVSAFLDSVQASPEERAVSAKQAAISQLESLGEDGDVTRTNVDALRTWLDHQAPGQTDSITGKALAEAAQAGGEFDYSAASQLVLQYQQSSGKDDVLIAFLQGYSAHSNLEEARHLADMISDPKRREQILGQLK